MTAISLTPAQRAILEQTVRHAEGRIDWFPPTIHGGARLKVLAGLGKRGLKCASCGTPPPWSITVRRAPPPSSPATSTATN
ncbi:MAG: hypothetical protein IT479_07145, partial [Xanthomonadales bacterium]|nr:hypothetical protein [Xanthomonadales bacterium]